MKKTAAFALSAVLLLTGCSSNYASNQYVTASGTAYTYTNTRTSQIGSYRFEANGSGTFTLASYSLSTGSVDVNDYDFTYTISADVNVSGNITALGSFSGYFTTISETRCFITNGRTYRN